MAALDFPASPVSGQTFLGGNGVTYQWQASPGLWLPIASNAPRMAGDFYAINSATISLSAGGIVVIPTSVQSGNSGGWYNTSNGRFTPPAGRYRIFAGFTVFNGGSTEGQTQFRLRKNGTNLINAQTAALGPGRTTHMDVDGTFDANGTDYFDLFGVSGGASEASGSAGQVWFGAIPLGAPATLTPWGDFWAYSASYSTTNAFTTATPPVITGNSGGWYNPTNGRYTPPAGRYKITASLACSVSGPSDVTINLRKNGTLIAQAVDTQGTAVWFANCVVDAVVDANGSDFFDIQIRSTSGTSNSLLSFSAIPVGVTAVSVPPGTMGLYSEQVLAANAAVLNVSIPTSFKRLQIDFHGRTSGVLESCFFNLMNGGSQIATGHYNTQLHYGANATSNAALVSASTSFNLGGFIFAQGTINLQRAADNTWMLWGNGYMQDATQFLAMTWAGSYTNPTPVVDGIRFQTSGANPLAAGAFLRAFVVT